MCQGRDTVQAFKYVLAMRRNLVPPSSGYERVFENL